MAIQIEHGGMRLQDLSGNLMTSLCVRARARARERERERMTFLSCTISLEVIIEAWLADIRLTSLCFFFFKRRAPTRSSGFSSSYRRGGMDGRKGRMEGGKDGWRKGGTDGRREGRMREGGTNEGGKEEVEQIHFLD